MLGEVPGMTDSRGRGLCLHAHSWFCAVWLALWLSSAPEPPRNNAIPVQMGEILFLVLQLSSPHALGKVHNYTYFLHVCIIHIYLTWTSMCHFKH